MRAGWLPTTGGGKVEGKPMEPQRRQRMIAEMLYIIGQRILPLACILLLLAGCAGRQAAYRPLPEARKKELARMGYAIQAGAFAREENASRLTEALKAQGVEATYFAAQKGLYRVRCGNFAARAAALNKAESLRSAGIIGEYYIVSPSEYAVARNEPGGAALREEIVRTARNFIGVLYLWGGTDADSGFDCSGLTMTVYQLNGLDLPRTSQEQAEVGSAVDRDHLSKGDLVFFRSSGKGNISHVGVYAGGSQFIHAPGKGKSIRFDSLSRQDYRRFFTGGRSYM